MPALVAGIHVFTACVKPKTWMAGTSPAMTVGIKRSLNKEAPARARGLSTIGTAAGMSVPIVVSKNYCTVSPCRARSRPSRSTSSLTRSPITRSTSLRMIKVTITS
jgi:hypothetical protein